MSAFAASIAMEVSPWRGSSWLSAALSVIAVVLLVAWAIPYYWVEWESVTTRLKQDRLISDYPAVSMSINADGNVSGNFTVSGRFWFQRDVVLDDIYVVFKQQRRRFWPKRELFRAHVGDSWLEFKLPEKSFNELRLKAGRQIKFEQTLFADLNVRPLRPAKHGKYFADLHVDLLVPDRSIRLRVGEETARMA